LAPLFGSIPTVKVYARAAYPSWDYKDPKWRDQDYNAHFFTHAVKNDRVKIGQRRTQLPMGAGSAMVWIDQTNLDVCQKFFARWVAIKCHRLEVKDPIFVAIPNRDALEDSKAFNTAKLARLAAAAFGPTASAYTGLRFKAFVPKDGKRQSVAELVSNMALIEPLPEAGTLVLLDDVYTLGHHITAAYKMMPKGRKPEIALVAAKTEKRPLPDMTVVDEENHWCF